LRRENRLLAVASSVEPGNKSVAHEHIVTHPHDGRDVLQVRRMNFHFIGLHTAPGRRQDQQNQERGFSSNGHESP
jgi:hypothetical protein